VGGRAPPIRRIGFSLAVTSPFHPSLPLLSPSPFLSVSIRNDEQVAAATWRSFFRLGVRFAPVRTVPLSDVPLSDCPLSPSAPCLSAIGMGAGEGAPGARPNPSPAAKDVGPATRRAAFCPPAPPPPPTSPAPPARGRHPAQQQRRGRGRRRHGRVLVLDGDRRP